MMKQRIFDQAVLLAGEMDKVREDVLYVLCGAWASSLAARLREGMTPEDCGMDFATAAALFALADLNALEEADVAEFKAGDLTVKKAGNFNGAARCLQRQGEMLIKPYVKDSFSFLGV